MRPPLLLAALVLVAGCDVFSGSSEPEFTRDPGQLVIDVGGPKTITVPETIRAGEPTAITVTTQGGGCVREGDTEVAFVDGAVEIRPYDLTQVLRKNEACTLLLQYFPHTVLVTFLEPGPVLVRAIGEARVGYNDDGTLRTEVQTRELGIVVR